MTALAAVAGDIGMAALPRVSNFRDAGGLSLGAARMVSGRVFRSAAPGRLASAEAAALRQLGVETIVDLRGVGEAGIAPTVFPQADGLRMVAAPVEPRTAAKVRQALADGTATAALMRDLMIESYRLYVTEAASSFGEALTVLVTSGRPALVHCTAGKDRTGFVVAVIQSALGASEDDIRADYLRTNRDWDRASVSGHLPLDSDVIAPILMAHEDYLAAAFDEIRRQDGDVLAFVRRATDGRVTSAHLDALIDPGARP